jgi:protein MpaA
MYMKRSYDEVMERLQNLDGKIKVDIIGYADSRKSSYPVYVAKYGSAMGNRIFLSAGIHGDEPAGVYSLLEFMEGPVLLHDDFEFSVFPCINPWGFENDKRFDYGGTDINRSFLEGNYNIADAINRYIADENGYVLAMNMHEDNTKIKVGDFPRKSNPRGFYLYEMSLDGDHMGPGIIRELENQDIGICKDKEIYGERNENGVIYSASENGELSQFLENYTKNIIVTETPTLWPIRKRILAQNSALRWVLGNSVTSS